MANGWSLDGNAVTAGEFLGTTNDQPLSVRTAGTERVHVQADGDIGVGLAEPRTQLHVLGRIASGLDFNSAGAITLFPPDGFAWFHIDNGPAGGRPIGRLRLSHGPAPGSNEIMTLVQNGNVGIATSSPATRLHVVGGRVRLESAGKVLDLRADGGAVDLQSDTHNLFVHSSGPAGRNHVVINPFGGEGNVGIGTENPRTKLEVAGDVRANDVVLTSDARLKTDVAPVGGALERLERIRGVEYALSGDTDGDGTPRRRIGVIAQEVEEVAPELVDDRGGDGYKGVNYGGLTAVLVEACKELLEENRALRQRVEALEQAVLSD
jgi:hypothetical protein